MIDMTIDEKLEFIKSRIRYIGIKYITEYAPNCNSLTIEFDTIYNINLIRASNLTELIDKAFESCKHLPEEDTYKTIVYNK